MKCTLRQGLDNFYKESAIHLSYMLEDERSAAPSFFTSHDIAHVLFGCDISLYGEGAVKIWTIFGTTLGFWKHLKAYRQVNALGLSKNFKRSDRIKDIFKLLKVIPAIIARARRMHKPWPWNDFEPYLDKPISEIREEFNIQVL